MIGMAKDVEKIGRANPAWPTHTPGNGHPVTEISSKLTGASSPFGDELILPRGQSQDVKKVVEALKGRDAG